MPAHRSHNPGPDFLRLVSQATRAATSSLDRDELATDAVGAVVNFVGATRADLWTFDDGVLRHQAGAGADLDKLPDAPLLWHRIAASRVSDMFEVTDVADSDGLEWQRVLFQLGCQALSVHSLFTGNTASGCLTVVHDSAPETEHHLALDMFADQVALALDKAKLHAVATQSAMSAQQHGLVLADLAECRELPTLIDVVRSHVARLVQDGQCAVALHDTHGRCMIFPAVGAPGSPTARPATDDECALFERFESDSDVRTVAHADFSPQTRARLSSLGFDMRHEPGNDRRAVTGAGLYAHGRLVGVLVADSSEPEAHGELARFLAMASPAIAIGLENTLMFTRATLRSNRLAAANDLARQLTTATDSDELFASLVSGLKNRFGYSRVAAYDIDGELICEHGAPSLDPRGERARTGDGAERRHASRIENGTSIAWTVPLRSRDRIVAVLHVEQRNALPMVVSFDDNERTLLESVAGHAAGALTTLSAYEVLERSYVATVQALASALEASDQYTHDHAQDVAVWAVEVGTRLGLAGRDLKDLELAAIFHDIGKIAIPSEILNKPGKLTEAEFDLMKTHTIVGERIIAPIEFLERVCPMVRHEHERWDGKGYPDGLAGEQIPLGSRIIFVCDAYHAITSDRPYREAQSHEVARRVLVENAGTQFDPAVVSVFLDVLETHLGGSGHAEAHDDAVRNAVPEPLPLDESGAAAA